MTDRRWIYAAAFCRALGVGMIGVLLGLHLAARGLDAGAVGAVVTSGLLGMALAALLVTARGEGAGKRRLLVVLAVFSAVGAAVLAVVRTEPLLLGAAFLGMVNGMGRDRGGAAILEQAVLPGTATDAERTMVFARYNVVQDVGHGLGGLLAVLPAVLGLPGSVLAYTGLALLPGLAALRLSPRVETVAGPAPPLSPESRRFLWKLSSLFAIDGLGGGFLTAALVAYFFHERFGVGAEKLGLLFFAARALNAGSHVAAAWLARRIGLVNTMVFTHLPSSLLLVTVAMAPTFPIAAALFLLREGLVEMDVPTRQSYVMAVVRPEERTRASGITHLVRLGAWAVAPVVAGAFMEGVNMAAPLVAGAALKISYDLLLWRAFRNVRPPEERGGRRA